MKWALGLSAVLAAVMIYLFTSRVRELSPQSVGPPEPSSTLPATSSTALPSGPSVESAGIVPRSPASQKPSTRQLSSASAEIFFRDSVEPWAIQRNETGFIAVLSGGNYPTGMRAPISASEIFLARFSEALFGAGSSSQVHSETRTEARTSQVIFQQVINGLPVFGSKINLFFDREGNLVHANANVFPGVPRAAAEPISASHAAHVAREAFLHNVGSAEVEFAVLQEGYPVGFFQSIGRLGYRYTAGAPALVYRYEVTTSHNEIGDSEIQVDAQSAQVVVNRHPK